MADSNITRRALASSLRELMAEISFEKISVANICERCEMSRKSFYYHFKDKYDLLNWIFDTETAPLLKNRPSDDWEFIERTCDYFYENRDFYRKALQIKGQNCFLDHFHEFAHPLLRVRIEELFGVKEVPEICIDLIADLIVCGIERWLLENQEMMPEEFVSIIKSMIQTTAVTVYQDMNQPK